MRRNMGLAKPDAGAKGPPRPVKAACFFRPDPMLPKEPAGGQRGEDGLRAVADPRVRAAAEQATEGAIDAVRQGSA